MNENIACYFINLLCGLRVDDDYIMTLANKGLDLVLVHEAKGCHWDPETKAVTTAQELACSREDDLEEEEWYEDDMGRLQEKHKKQGKPLTQLQMHYLTWTKNTPSNHQSKE